MVDELHDDHLTPNALHYTLGLRIDTRRAKVDFRNDLHRRHLTRTLMFRKPHPTYERPPRTSSRVTRERVTDSIGMFNVQAGASVPGQVEGLTTSSLANRIT